MELIGRKSELSTLNKLWQKESSSLIALTGRRRIGKSRLIQEFGKSSNTYFEVQGLAPHKEMKNQDQIDYFVNEMNKCFNVKIPSLTSWQEVFNTLADLTNREGRTLIFLDEISWMGAFDATFPSVLKAAWDTKFRNKKNIIIVLCGSVSSWIQQNILNSTDFFGRFSLVLHLEELPLIELPLFFKNFATRISTTDLLALFAITGGVPRYLEEINPKLPVNENIQNLCFKKDGLLVDEFEKIFSDIFAGKQMAYKRIVTVLTHGRKSFSEICKSINLPRSGVITQYLLDLELSGFLAVDIVYAKGVAKKIKYYRLKDNYLRFYLRYIFPVKAKIKQGLYENTKLGVLKEWSIISGLQFENLILSNLKIILNHLNLDPHEVLSASPHIQKKSSKNRGSCQIDLLIETKSSIYYLCEIKKRKNIDVSVIKEIERKAKIFHRPKNSSIQHVLIYDGVLTDDVLEADLINYFISADQLLGR